MWSRRPPLTSLLWNRRAALPSHGGIPYLLTRLSIYKDAGSFVRPTSLDQIQFHDRSVVCTAALAVFLGYPCSTVLSQELKRIAGEKIFQRQVFFIQNLGFVAPTEARRISFEDSLRFERLHEDIYRNFGFELVAIAPGSLEDRVDAIKRSVKALCLTVP